MSVRWAKRCAAILLMAAGLGGALSTSAFGEAKPLVQSCWPPSALVAKPGENVARKGDHHFDAPAPWAPLAAFPTLPIDAEGVIRRVTVTGGRKLIALTFDLCEQPGEVAGYDGAIVDYLRKQHVKATFFAGGKWLRSHEERAQQLMSDPLFEIGNHSEAHRNLRGLTGTRLVQEIVGPQRAYEAIRAHLAQSQCVKADPDAMSRVAPRISLFRFPYGACNALSLHAVHDQGLRAVQWDFSTGDPWPIQSAKAIVHVLLSRARPGSIILAHANGRGWHTAAALPVAIPKLRQMGFEFVTVSELLAAGTPVMAQRCYDSRPGDTDRYDKLAAHHPLAEGRHSGPSK
jgi:peptidoglycan-N-acetylglucosamine deacetylase